MMPQLPLQPTSLTKHPNHLIGIHELLAYHSNTSNVVLSNNLLVSNHTASTRQAHNHLPFLVQTSCCSAFCTIFLALDSLMPIIVFAYRAVDSARALSNFSNLTVQFFLI